MHAKISARMVLLNCNPASLLERGCSEVRPRLGKDSLSTGFGLTHKIRKISREMGGENAQKSVSDA